MADPAIPGDFTRKNVVLFGATGCRRNPVVRHSPFRNPPDVEVL
jgi:hypothetical protein